MEERLQWMWCPHTGTGWSLPPTQRSPNISQLFPAASKSPRHMQNARLLCATAAGSKKKKEASHRDGMGAWGLPGDGAGVSHRCRGLLLRFLGLC